MQKWSSLRQIENGPDKGTIAKFISIIGSYKTKREEIVVTAIHSETKEIETKTFKHSDPKLLDWVVEKNNSQHNLYWLVNLAYTSLKKKPTKDQIAGMAWIHVDIDIKDNVDFSDEAVYDNRIDEIVNSLTKSELPPTLILFSGNGIQAFWKAEKPFDARKNPEHFEELNVRAQLRFKGDSCFNIDRVMRFPGTINWPDEKKKSMGRVPVLSSIVDWDETRLFTIGDFLEWEAPQTEEDEQSPEVEGVPSLKHLEKQLKDEISTESRVPEDLGSILAKNLKRDHELVRRYNGNANGLKDTSRSGVELSLVSQLRRRGYSPSQIWAVLHERPEKYGNKLAEEARKNVGSAIRYLARMLAVVVREELIAEKIKEDAEQEFNELAKRLYLVMDQDKIFDLGSCSLLARSVVNSRYAFLAGQYNTSKKAKKIIDLLEDEGKLRFVSSMTFYPGKDRILHDRIGFPHSEEAQVNLWTPRTITPEEGDCSRFIQHLENMIPEKEEREFFLGYLAHMVQYPGVKIRHAPILVGPQGSGKSYFGEVMRAILGQPNVTSVSTTSLKSGNNGYMSHSELVVMEEVLAPGRLDISNALKDKITEDRVEITEKYIRSYQIPNRCNFIFLSNHIDALHLEHNDRRFFVVQTTFPPRDISYYTKLFEPLVGYRENPRGVAAIAHFLANWDWRATGFSPNKAPPVTLAKRAMITESEAQYVEEVEQALEFRTWPFDAAIVSNVEILSWLRGMNYRVTREKLSILMDRLGVERFKNRTRIEGERVQLTYFVLSPDDEGVKNMREGFGLDNLTSEELAKIIADSKEGHNVVPFKEDRGA